MKVRIGLFLPLFRQNFYTFPFFSTGDRPLMSMIKPLKMAHCKSILNTKELTTRWRVQTTHGRASLLPLVVSPQLRSNPVDLPPIVTHASFYGPKGSLGLFWQNPYPNQVDGQGRDLLSESFIHATVGDQEWFSLSSWAHSFPNTKVCFEI